MADLSITVAEVAEGSSATTKSGTAGAAITQGQAVVNVGTGIYLADANHTTTSYQNCAGISLNAAQIGQPVDYDAKDEELVIGTTNPPAPGKIYVVGTTAGGIMPIDDLSTVASSTQKVTVLGVGVASGKLFLKIINSQTAWTA